MFNRRPRPPRLIRTPEQRQRLHARVHGLMIAAWGIWVALFGARNFAAPAFAAFGSLPHWTWGLSAAALGAAITAMASSRRAMAIRAPGVLATMAWAIIAALIFIGDFRTTGVPIYGGLAIYAYAVMVRE
jgi:hypothetical protein